MSGRGELLRTVSKKFTEIEKVPVPEKTEEEADGETLFAWVECIAFAVLLLLCQAFFVVIYSIWFDYTPIEDAFAEFEDIYYLYRDVAIMIFFGFGYLMTFPRRYGYTAIGMTFLIAAFVVQWSIILDIFFHGLDDNFDYFSERVPITIYNVLNGCFCSGAVLITFGALLGKVTPLQMVVLAIIEPVFFWLNFFICDLKLSAVDIGGGFYIHIFGAYFGLACAFFLTDNKASTHPDNISCYTSDLFAFAGTLFLFLLWPSFNAAIAPTGIERVRAVVNTMISLCGATVVAFVASRIVSGSRFDPVHIQNATLAGGVVMGIAAHLEIFPGTALAMGMLAGLVSVMGYLILTPILAKFFHCHDTCGVHNLHGMPGVLGAILSIFATMIISLTQDDYVPEYEHGTLQCLIQLAALGITLGIAIIPGLVTGLILFLLSFLRRIHHRDYFNDRETWELPSDYETFADKTD